MPLFSQQSHIFKAKQVHYYGQVLKLTEQNGVAKLYALAPDLI